MNIYCSRRAIPRHKCWNAPILICNKAKREFHTDSSGRSYVDMIKMCAAASVASCADWKIRCKFFCLCAWNSYNLLSKHTRLKVLPCEYMQYQHWKTACYQECTANGLQNFGGQTFLRTHWYLNRLMYFFAVCHFSLYNKMITQGFFGWHSFHLSLQLPIEKCIGYNMRL